MKFYRKQLRWKEFNYNGTGLYFVTICTKNKKCLFGSIKGDETILTELGEIAHKYWEDIPCHFENVTLYDHVVMPNHIHGIIQIIGEDEAVVKRHAFSLRKYQRLPIIIGSYKSAVSKQVNKSFPNKRFAWQTSYHERVIRTENEFRNIVDYINLNPANWNRDLENPDFNDSLSVEQRNKLVKDFYKSLR